MRDSPNSTQIHHLPQSWARGRSLSVSGLSFLIYEMGTEGVPPTLCDSEGYMTSGIISKLSHLPPLPPSTATSSSSSLHAPPLSPPPTLLPHLLRHNLLPHHPRQRRPSAKNYGRDPPGPETLKMNMGSYV